MADEQRTGGIRRLLSVPIAYSLSQRAVGARRSRRLLVSRHIRPAVGERVLDIGCGPGELLDELPAVDYLGFDLNRRYVEAARQRYGSRGRFLCADVRETDLADEAPFDIVLAVGLLHHLDDEGVHRLLRLATNALAPSGRMVTFDGVFVPGQPRAARWLIERDRGRHVRSVEDQVRLFADHFGSVNETVSHDLMRIPYTHIIIEASAPKPA